MNPKQRELVVSGYIREAENNDKYVSNIPDGIDGIIMSYLPTRIRFDLFNNTRFKLEGDSEEVLAVGASPSCEGYFAYPENYHGADGMKQGVHFWSMTASNVHDCYRYIGVSSVRCSEYTEWAKTGAEYGWDDTWTKKDNHYLYVEGGYRNWKKEDTFTVKLDCNKWRCAWYKNATLFKEIDVQPNVGYFWIGQFCAARAKYHNVPTPDHYFT